MSLRAEFERCWPLLEPAIAKELGGAAFTMENVWAQIEASEAFLWSTEYSACLTEVQDNPGRRVAVVWVMGGKMGDLLTNLLPNIEVWARSIGCQYLVGSGRTGKAWERVLKKHDFFPVHTTYGKEL